MDLTTFMGFFWTVFELCLDVDIHSPLWLDVVDVHY